MSDELINLNRRKRNVQASIAKTKASISEAEDEIERLRKASEALDSNIEDLESIKEDVSAFEVTKGKWRGDEEEDFTEKYEEFESSVKKYAKETKHAQS